MNLSHKIANPSQIHNTLNLICSFHEHIREVHSADITKLWTLDRPPPSAPSRGTHTYCVYSSVWNPRHADVFPSASGDCTLRIWDVREPSSTMNSPLTISRSLRAIGTSTMTVCCDWNFPSFSMLRVVEPRSQVHHVDFVILFYSFFLLFCIAFLKPSKVEKFLD